MAEELARELGLQVIQFNDTDKAKGDTAVDHEVQFIPANINHDGSQEIGTYFTKFIRKNEEKGCLEASLRGRPLEGEILKLPEGYEAAVIQAVGSDGDTFREVKRVKQLTYWNYDKVPSDSDQFKKAVQWLKIADVMHGGGEDEEPIKKEESKEN